MTCVLIQTITWKCKSLGRYRRFISSPQLPDLLRALPSILFYDYRSSFPVVKRPSREAGHSYPSRSEIKNQGNHSSCHMLHDVHIRGFVVRGYRPKNLVIGCVCSCLQWRNGVSYEAINQLTCTKCIYSPNDAICASNIWYRMQTCCQEGAGVCNAPTKNMDGPTTNFAKYHGKHADQIA